ncbi:MAG: Gfo/Idh/MocA family oxidoreductase [Clostridiaceae bacterium]|nr:Gfo/Idh/MocA family oxidoreductase [Clostridiaceae bacterium]
MKKYGFGIIGTGMIGKLHANAISRIENAKLVAVFSKNYDNACKMAEKYNCKAFSSMEEFLNQSDLDVVSICTPSGTHGEYAVEAANAGKHLLIEKPIEITVEKAEEIISACLRNNVKCSVISQHRFDDSVIQLKKAIEDGKLGRIYFGSCFTKWYRNDEYYKSSNWKGTWKYDGGGALMNQSIHYIDLLLYVMGDVAEVYGKCAALLHDIEVEDTGVAVLKFKSGALGMIEGTTAAYPGFYTKLEIHGENGTVIIENDLIKHWSIKGEENLHISEAVNAETGASAPDGISIVPHVRQFNNFIQALKNDTAPLITAEDGKRAVELILAIYESSKKGSPVLL